jgi:hypothetical protein
MSGVQAVWVIRTNKTASLYTPGVEPIELGVDGVLRDENLLPGFACPVAELFP